jgi:uncharacterized protein YjbI with pentapeptide repeats
MFAVFLVMHQLHELLWYLTEALSLQPARSLHGALSLALEKTERLTYSNPDSLLGLDMASLRADINTLLLRTSLLVRAGTRHQNKDCAGVDFIGTNLRGADLRGANMRGAYLIGADLSCADLRVADLLGTDLRAADLSGADLTGCIFLTQSQLNAAKGDTGTKLPSSLTRPTCWSRRERRR